MKKILSIALIAALVAGSVFAATFTGEAALDFGFDLDSKVYGFANASSTKLNFGFEFASGEGGKTGEKDLKAEIAGQFTVEFKAADYKESGAEVKATVSTLKLTKANILYKDILTVGILDAGSSPDYASSYNTATADIKDGSKVVVEKGKTVSNLIGGLDGVPGFTVKAYGVEGGFGLKGVADKTKEYEVLAHATVADKELAEGLKLSAGLGALISGKNSKNTSLLQANLKGSYSDSDKLSASLALDFITGLATDEDTLVGLEAAAAAKYDFVNLNAYFYFFGKDYVVLDAKLAAKKTFTVNENVSVTVDGSFEGNNIANKKRYVGDYTQQNGGAQEFTPAVDASCTVDKFTFGAGASYGIKAKALVLNASVKYADSEMFTAELKAKFGKTVKTDKTSTFTLEASISSDQVIDGATLSLTYKSGDNLLKDQAKAQSLGKITAEAKVAF